MNFNGKQFGRRINAWHVVTHLMEMRDTGNYWKYSLETVNYAIDIEAVGEIPLLWGKVEA